MNNITELIPNKPDKEIAEELKQKIAEALQPVCKVMDEAAKDGFTISFGLGPGPFGKNAVMQLAIVKHY